MSAIDVGGLKRRMAAAISAEDFETAAMLRDELRALEGAVGLRRQREGAMGIGTDVPKPAKPVGWTPPKRPDLMTRGIKPRRGGR